MTRDRNIFYRIPVTKDENFVTELLVNLLRTKFMRDSILKELKIPEKVVKNIKLEHISTQTALEQEGIPDITIKNSESFYLIENKIREDTVLQENQLNGYVSKVKENPQYANRACIFLVPEGYHHLGRLKELRENHKTNDGCDFIQIVYWESLLKYLFSLEIQNESPVIKESLECLCETVLGKTSLDDEGISFSAYEVAMLYNPRDIIESFHVCEKVYEKMQLIGKKLVDKKELNIQLGRPYSLKNSPYGGIGQSLTYNGNECIFIGLNMNLLHYNAKDIHDSTKKAEDYVFAIAFDSQYLKNFDLSKSVDYLCDDRDVWIYRRLCKKHLVDEQDNGALESEIEKIITDVFLPNVK